MRGPLAIEKSNFLIEPIYTPFSLGSLRTTAAVVRLIQVKTSVEQWPSLFLFFFSFFFLFYCAFAMLNPLIWTQTCFVCWMREEHIWGKMREEEEGIIDDMIQREMEKEGEGKLWWCRNIQGCKLRMSTEKTGQKKKKAAASFACVSADIKEERVKVWVWEGNGGTQPCGTTDWLISGL